ncbi:MAG: glycosyltransferase [Acidobacteria bacterium]|jgi:colanic acid/amylovoran biosynthesis glycosyltransferase|nr:glycosyltransferase [Acidobacteriota bacterium]
MRTVAHFIRKFLPLTYTFVKNQISSHNEYKPYIFFKELVTPEIHANEIIKNFNTNNISELNNKYERLLYDKFRVLSSNDIVYIKRKLALLKPNILHFHFGTDAGMYYKIMKYSKIPSVVSFYGYDCSSFPKSYFGYGKWYLRMRVFPYATKILAMSENMREDLLQIGCPKEKIIVHYYGTDVDRFGYIKRKYTQNSTVKLLIICTLFPYKGHLFLLNAIKNILQRGCKNFNLRIIGDGYLRENIESFISGNNLNDYVTMVGKLNYGTKEFINELEQADIFVHPSIEVNGVKEGIPGAVIEAMSAGLPVISTYHAGIPYVIENNITGILVKEWDVNCLSESLIKLINDVNLRRSLGGKAKIYAKTQLNLKMKEIELENIYSQIQMEVNYETRNN